MCCLISQQQVSFVVRAGSPELPQVEVDFPFTKFIDPTAFLDGIHDKLPAEPIDDKWKEKTIWDIPEDDLKALSARVEYLDSQRDKDQSILKKVSEDAATTNPRCTEAFCDRYCKCEEIPSDDGFFPFWEAPPKKVWNCLSGYEADMDIALPEIYNSKQCVCEKVYNGIPCE